MKTVLRPAPLLCTSLLWTSILLAFGGLAFGGRALGAQDPPPPTPETDVSRAAPDPDTEIPEAIRRAVDHEDRWKPDRARDENRKPAEVLSFFGIEPGMRVIDCMGGDGYYSELLSRVVGDEGRVWIQNNPFVVERFVDRPLKARMKDDRLPNLTRLDAELDDMGLPDEVDAVVLVRFYHDFYWMGNDRAKFNAQVLEALVPGGVYCVLDHHAEEGSGSRDNQTLHRIDMELVKKEILEAGFVLDGSSDCLADPEDTRDWNIFKEGGRYRDSTDRFVLRFKKPLENKKER